MNPLTDMDGGRNGAIHLTAELCATDTDQKKTHSFQLCPYPTLSLPQAPNISPHSVVTQLALVTLNGSQNKTKSHESKKGSVGVWLIEAEGRYERLGGKSR